MCPEMKTEIKSQYESTDEEIETMKLRIKVASRVNLKLSEEIIAISGGMDKKVSLSEVFDASINTLAYLCIDNIRGLASCAEHVGVNVDPIALWQQVDNSVRSSLSRVNLPKGVVHGHA